MQPNPSYDRNLAYSRLQNKANHQYHSVIQPDWMPLYHQLNIYNKFRLSWGPRDPITQRAPYFGPRFINLTWHRQAGKDEILLWMMAMFALYNPNLRRGHVIAYSFPENKQIKSVIGETGRIFNVINPSFIEKYNSQEQRLYFKNGVQAKLFGSDNFESIRGHTFPAWFRSEWQSSNPDAEAVIDPALTNDAIKATVGTPLGDNWFYNDHVMCRDKSQGIGLWPGERAEDYHAEYLPCTATGLIPPQRLAQLFEKYKLEYGPHMAEMKIRQEFMCDWSGGSNFPIFGNTLRDLENKGRVGDMAATLGLQIPLPGVPVNLAFDLGRKQGGDPMVAIAFQVVIEPLTGDMDILVLDCKADQIQDYGQFIDWAVQNNYTGGYCILPHDEGMSRQWPGDFKSYLRSNGFTYFNNPANDPRQRDAKSYSILESDSIWFDKKCLVPMWADPSQTQTYGKSLWNALKAYSWDYKTDKKDFVPEHKWPSHWADAFGEMVIGVRRIFLRSSLQLNQPTIAESDGMVYHKNGQMVMRTVNTVGIDASKPFNPTQIQGVSQ